MAVTSYTTPSRGGSKVPDELKQLVTKGKDARKPFERDMFLNMAYFVGDQWCWWNHGRIERPDPRRLPENTVLLVDNRINGIVRTEVAKMTKQNPGFVVTPRTGDEEDVNSALLGEQVLQDRWEALYLHRKLMTALSWARICNAGFWKVYWDPSAGDGFDAGVDDSGEPFTDPRTGRPMSYDALPPQIQDQVTKKTVSQGDVCVEARSPFEIIPDPLAESLDDCEWLIEEAVRSKEYLLKRYPDVAGIEQVKEDADADYGISESRMVGASHKSGGGYKGVRVFEYWAKPSSKFPNGKRCVWTKDLLLTEDLQPFDALPYVMFSGIDVPGRFWPTAITTLLRGPQTELNKTISQIAQNRNRFGNPAILISKMANVTYHGVPGEKVEFDDTTQNAVPTFLQAPAMPQYVIDERERMVDSLREISGQHEVTSGSVPAGVTAASAINLLQEQDDTRLGPATRDMEVSLGQAGTKILQLVAMFYDDTRTLRISGEEGAWTIKDFKGSMLRGNTRVQVQAGSMAPRSQAAKTASMQEFLNMAVQSGAAFSRRELAQFAKDMQIGAEQGFIDHYSRDETQVNRENRLLASGVRLDINSFDDDEAHIDGHEAYQKTSAYQQLDDMVKQAFELHTSLHRQRIQAQFQLAQPQPQLPGFPQGQLPPGPPNGGQ